MNEQHNRTNIRQARRVYLRKQETDRARPTATQTPPNPENAVRREFARSEGINVSAMITAGLVAMGLAAVEAVRIGLMHEALEGFFAGASGALPFAVVLTLGLAALDMGLLLRLFAPASDWRNMSVWSAIGAWLLATTGNSILVMYALGDMVAEGHQLADVAPAGVAIALLVLRLLLVGALAWDAGEALGRTQ